MESPWRLGVLEASSFEVLLERGKIVCFLDCYPSSKVPRGPPKRLIYPPHPPALPVRGPPQTEVFRYFSDPLFSWPLGCVFSPRMRQKEPLLTPSWEARWHQNRSKVIFKTPSIAKMKVFKFPLFYNTFVPSRGSQDGNKSCSRRFCSLLHVCRFSYRF